MGVEIFPPDERDRFGLADALLLMTGLAVGFAVLAQGVPEESVFDAERLIFRFHVATTFGLAIGGTMVIWPRFTERGWSRGEWILPLIAAMPAFAVFESLWSLGHEHWLAVAIRVAAYGGFFIATFVMVPLAVFRRPETPRWTHWLGVFVGVLVLLMFPLTMILRAIVGMRFVDAPS